MITAGVTGFATGLTLILAIGAQNAFVLRQGLARAHVFWLCLLCATSDALLVTIGVLGFGAMITFFPQLPLVMAWAGALFLLIYGALRLMAAYRGDYHLQIEGQTGSLWATLATGAALTWLNPHVYLDTVGLMGAISTDFPIPDRYAFGAGAVIASFVFFFSLGFGARLLAPLMTSPRAWRALDVMIAIVMWGIAYHLIS